MCWAVQIIGECLNLLELCSIATTINMEWKRSVKRQMEPLITDGLNRLRYIFHWRDGNKTRRMTYRRWIQRHKKRTVLEGRIKGHIIKLSLLQNLLILHADMEGIKQWSSCRSNAKSMTAYIFLDLFPLSWLLRLYIGAISRISYLHLTIRSCSLLSVRPDVDKWIHCFGEKCNNHTSYTPPICNIRPVFWDINIPPNEHKKGGDTTQVSSDPVFTYSAC